LPYIKENRVSWFARNYKVGVRRGDAVEKVMVELV
jgi:ribosomal protein L17